MRKSCRKEKQVAKSKKTPERINIIEKTIIDTGSEKTAFEKAKISKTTFQNWKKNDMSFMNLVTRAHKRFENLNLRNRTDLREKAVESLENLLTERKVDRDQVKITKFFDKDGNMTGHKEETIRKTVVRDPSYYAIEKVLGKREIEYIVLNKAIQDGKEDKDSPLFKRMFGDWGEHSRELKGFEDNIFSDTLDLIKLRHIQAETMKRYDQGRLSFEEWELMTRNQSKDYISVKDKIERRAMGLIEGYTPQELLLQIKQFVFMLNKTLEEVVNDIGINRQDIPAELSRKIKQKSALPSEA